jgi:hypothetical protein
MNDENFQQTLITERFWRVTGDIKLRDMQCYLNIFSSRKKSSGMIVVSCEFTCCAVRAGRTSLVTTDLEYNTLL